MRGDGDSTTGRYSKVSRRIWNDAKFRKLTPPPPNGQTLFIRLLTAPELGTIPGLFAAGEAGLAEALEWPLEGFREAFREVFREGLVKADWKARLVFVPKALRHNKPESPNVVRGWRNTWDELPECDLKVEAYRQLKDLVEGYGEGYAKAFAEACGQPSPNQEQEQEQEGEEHSRCEAPAPPTPKPDPIESQKPKKAKSTRLPEDWQPPPELVDRLRRELAVDPMPVLRRFKNHWLNATRNAVKPRWDLAFENWVERDAADGKLPREDPELSLPILSLPNRDAFIPRDGETLDFSPLFTGEAQR